MGEKLKAVWNAFLGQLKDIWDKAKAPLVAVGILFLIVKFRDLFLTILLNSSKRIDKNAHKQDTKLEAQETELKQEADVAVQQAAEEPQKEAPVTDDWYKNS